MVPDPFYREFGQRVRAARGRRSQSDLAASAGLTRSAIANIEIGRNRVAIDIVDRLARALGVAPESLWPEIPAGRPSLALDRNDRAAVDRVLARAGLGERADAPR